MQNPGDVARNVSGASTPWEGAERVVLGAPSSPVGAPGRTVKAADVEQMKQQLEFLKDKKDLPILTDKTYQILIMIAKLALAGAVIAYVAPFIPAVVAIALTFLFTGSFMSTPVELLIPSLKVVSAACVVGAVGIAVAAVVFVAALCYERYKNVKLTEEETKQLDERIEKLTKELELAQDMLKQQDRAEQARITQQRTTLAEAERRAENLRAELKRMEAGGRNT